MLFYNWLAEISDFKNRNADLLVEKNWRTFMTLEKHVTDTMKDEFGITCHRFTRDEYEEL